MEGGWSPPSRSGAARRKHLREPHHSYKLCCAQSAARAKLTAMPFEGESVADRERPAVLAAGELQLLAGGECADQEHQVLKTDVRIGHEILIYLERLA